MYSRYIWFLFCFLGVLGISSIREARADYCFGQQQYQYFQTTPASVVSVDPNAPLGSVLATGVANFAFTCFGPDGRTPDVVGRFTLTSGDSGQTTAFNTSGTSVGGVGTQHTFTNVYVNGQYRPDLERPTFGVNSASVTNVQTIQATIGIRFLKIGNITGGTLNMTQAAQAWFYKAVGGDNQQGRIGIMISNLQFNVEQPKASCRLTTPSLTVPLQAASINTLNQAQTYQTVNAGRFSIGVSCTANARVELAFTDAYNSNNSLLQLNSTMTNQQINGVGLSIIPVNSQYKGSNLIRDSLPVDFIGSLNQNIPFDVYYQRQPSTGPILVPGEFRSVANFTLTYQ